MRAFEAMEASVVALEKWSGDDLATPDAQAVYAAAAQIHAAGRSSAAAGIQPDDRIPVPDFIACHLPGGGEGQ